MQERYHIDLSEPGLIDARSGRWLRVRIIGLFDGESRIRSAIFPPKEVT